MTDVDHDSVAKQWGEGSPPYIIAEMSGNHNQSLDRALSIVDAAADAGAHAIKLQTYTAATMTLDLAEGEFVIKDSTSLWYGETMYGLYERAQTPWEWHRPIMERALMRGLACFSSPFDDSAVDFLEELGVPAYKIASFELIDLPLIKRVAATGKPLLISMGMATIAEIAEAVDCAQANGCGELVLLKCSSSYPASPKDTNLRTIAHMAELFSCKVGLSDHTMGIGVALAAVACGATVIEKHFTLSRAAGGVDSAFSLEPSELRALVVESKRAWQALGDVHYGPSEVEVKGRLRRRSLYIGEDLQPGDILTAHNLRRIRPGHGLAPKYYEMLLGRRVNRAVKKGTAVTMELIG